MRHARNPLAVAASDAFVAQRYAEWVDRYGPRLEEYRLSERRADGDAYAEMIGADSLLLLTAIAAPTAPV